MDEEKKKPPPWDTRAPDSMEVRAEREAQGQFHPTVQLLVVIVTIALLVIISRLL